MNPEKNKQNIQKPDLDFILNQNPTGETEKKGLDKKIIVIFVLVIVTLLVMALSLFIGSNQKVQKSNTNSYASIEQEKAGDVVESFLEKVNANDYEGAYALLSQDTPISNSDFANQVIPSMKQMKIDECQPDQNPETLLDEGNRLIRGYVCSSKQDDTKSLWVFSLSSLESGDYRIYTIWVASYE